MATISPRVEPVDPSKAVAHAHVPITPEQEQRLGDLYRSHAPWLRRTLAYRWAHLFDDIVQDIFLQIRRKPLFLSKMDNPRGWLLKVGHRVGFNLHRTNMRRLNLHKSVQLMANGRDDFEKKRLVEMKYELVCELKKLPGKRRAACARRFLNGERFYDISTKVGIAERTVKRWARDFLAHFQSRR